MRQKLVNILDLSMTLTFDLYVGVKGIVSEFYPQFLSCYKNEYALSSSLSVFFTWLLLYWGKIMLLSYATVDFHLFYDGAADMQIWAIMTV